MSGRVDKFGRILHEIRDEKMGRKLDGCEGAGLFLSAAEAGGQDRTGLSRSEDLQHRIAEQLGIPAAELRDPSETPSAVHGANNSVQLTDPTLSRECLELLDAYIRITDPELRRRCLQAVREVAYGSVDADSATRA
jgi:hypothetical protein